MFRTLTGRLPFGEEGSPAQLREAYANDPDLIWGMLHKDPRARLTIDEVKAHVYFQGIDWSVAARHADPAPWAPLEAYVPKNPRAFLNPAPSWTSQGLCAQGRARVGGRDTSSQTDKIKADKVKTEPADSRETSNVPLHSTAADEKIKTGGQDRSRCQFRQDASSSLASKVRSFFCHSPPPRPSIVKANIVHLRSGRPLVELPTDTTSSSLDRRMRESKASPLWTMLRWIFTRCFADPAVANSGKSSGNSPYKAGATSISNGARSSSPDRGSSRNHVSSGFGVKSASIACSPLPPVYAYYARMLEFQSTRSSNN
ncbi:hypothetical protein B0H19DRAFT_1262874 [Mycena capillaripes]|nr:hypothetical protein B0H19DRAFT_1262874 [Mycena capillaripes]